MSQWQRYPSVPASHTVKGRVEAVDGVSLQLQGQPQKWVLPAEWGEILRPGDWISALPHAESLKEICLLAPFLGLGEEFSSQGLELRQQHQHFQNYLGLVADFFRNRGLQRVSTPTLVVCPGTEPYLDVFSTEYVEGRHRQQFFLPTSPELSLKKLLAQGVGDLFEIRPCFRNGEKTPLHRPEFWMLEWYRNFANLEVIKQDFIDLVDNLVEKVGNSKPKRVVSRSMQDLFREFCDYDLQPDTTAADLQELCRRLGVHTGSASSYDDLFFMLVLEKIEPRLDPEAVTFVEKYPPSQAALARLTADGWGDRFEIYWQGMELANAFHELNDPTVQRQRFQEDLAKKSELGKQPVPLDEEFLKYLEHGMPPSSGIALGLERLYMALTSKNLWR